ncbi:bifunctional UDP-glucuronic acid oxidase/UDP-4-amino-4-deoxy-L-arabinose formyltransferase [Vibrio cholerae]|nr:putative monosaccharide biosynthesis protein [Vibrio cholerae]GHZ93414.1 bifunctional UDP-glucuronic acid oxidase/UDP-4-amino-4-deoxy-L-arabinose formyltransferase [Vibrio cholerae]
MKLAVITDNFFLLEEFKKIIENKKKLVTDIKYFASPKSSNKLMDNTVKIISLKDEWYKLSDRDIVFSLHCKQIFPSELVRTVTCINIHPGLNPYNRGWFPQVFAINNGMPHGATIHIMDEEIDHGDIIAQVEVKIFEHDTSKSVYERTIKSEIELLDDEFESILTGKYSTTPMQNNGNYNCISDFNHICNIDMDRKGTFRDFYNLLRSLTHEPYKNGYFYNDDGDKVYLSLNIEISKSLVK